MGRRPPLDVRQILAWADAHYVRTGQYPDTTCGWLVDAPEENWFYIDGSLRTGSRGLPSGWSLARLMDELRGKRNIQDLPRHTVEQILAWADAHYARTGEWPRHGSGSVVDASAENWQAIDMALRAGDEASGHCKLLVRSTTLQARPGVVSTRFSARVAVACPVVRRWRSFLRGIAVSATEETCRR